MSSVEKAGISDLRLLACGVALEEYPRDDTLWEALRRLDVKQVIDLRQRQNYTNTYHDSLDKGERQSKRIFRRIARKPRSFCSLLRYVVSIVQTTRKKQVDIIFVFPRNGLLLICLGLLKFYHGAKVYFDLFVSAYLFAVSNSLGRITVARRWVGELLGIKLADQLICTTPEYAGYFRETYKARTGKFSIVHDGVQDIWLDEPVTIKHGAQQPRRVLYWGTFLVQHGMDIIVDAAKELRSEDIEFIFCGGGQREAAIKEQARKKDLTNVVFRGFIPTTKELIRLVDSADVCFGHLKDTHDASLETSGKVKQAMARGKPAITLWTKQKQHLYQTKDNPFPPLILINPDPKSLAKAIMEVVENPRRAKRIGKAARDTVKRLHGIEMVASQLRGAFEKSI